MSAKFRLTKVSAVALAVACTIGGVSGLSAVDSKAAQETEDAAAVSAGYCVPSAGMSAVISDFCDFSQGSGVEYLATTAVASGESVSEYVTDSGSLLGKYIVCIADDYTNVYAQADESGEITAKIYTNGVATLLSLDWEWCLVVSDGVVGYVKTADFVFGELAEELDGETYVETASVTEDDLYVYSEADTDSTVVCVIQSGEDYTIVSGDDGSGYTLLSIDGVGEAYVETESIESSTERIYAVTVEEEEAQNEAVEEGTAAAAEIEEEKAAEAARIAAEEEAARIAAEEEAARIAEEEAAAQAEAEAAAEKAAEEAAAAKAAEEAAAKKAAEEAAAAAAAAASASVSESSDADEIAQALVDYACSFIGVLSYKYGGSSLTSGVDCSGFVMAVYAQFGYSLPHSSYSMRSVGTEVSYSDIKLGDIVCYSGHVGIYIGNGLIVNAPQSGETVSTKSVNYKKIITIRRVIS